MRDKIKTAVSIYKRRSIVGVLLAFAAVLAVIIIADVLAGSNNLGLDITHEQYSVLTGTTKSIVSGLDKDIYLYYVGRFEQQDMMTTQLLKNYASASKRIHYRLIDTIENAGALERIQNKNIKQHSVIVSDADLFKGGIPVKYAVLAYEDLYSDLGQYRNAGPGDTIVFSGEQRITSAIEYTAGKAEDRAVFLTGQDEGKPCNSLLSDTAGLFYSAEFLSEYSDLDPSSDTLIVVSPRKDITGTGYANIKKFLDSGGHAIFFIDSLSVDEITGETAYPEELKNFKALLAQYGLSVNSDVVLGGNPLWTYKSPANIIPSVYPDAARQFAINDSLKPVLNYASSITLSQVSGVTSMPLLVTDGSCYARATDGQPGGLGKAPGDRTGSFIVGAALNKDKTSIAVFTTSSFIISDEDYAYQGNSRLFLRTLSFLSDDLSGISINPKLVYSFRDPSSRLINVPGIIRLLLIIVVVIALPMIPVTAAVLRRIRRRNLS